MKRLLFITLLCVYSSAQASITYSTNSKSYDDILNSWINKSEASLIKSWGAPDNTYQLKKYEKIITYKKQTGVNRRNRNESISSGGVRTKRGDLNRIIPDGTILYCNTTFTIENEKISKWKWDGNDCK